MPAKKKVDGTKLIKMVEAGAHQSEIMEAFKLSTAAQVKMHYVDALMKTGKAAEIKTGRAKVKSNSAKEVVVSKRGSVVISKAIIDEMGFVQGDKFTVRKTKAGISLRKL